MQFLQSYGCHGLSSRSNYESRDFFDTKDVLTGSKNVFLKGKEYTLLVKNFELYFFSLIAQQNTVKPV